MKFAFIAAVAVCGALATACTVTTTTGGGGSGGEAATTTTGNATVTSTHATGTVTTGATPTTATGGGTCTNPVTADDCTSCITQASCEDTTGTATGCCEKLLPDGEGALQGVIFADCACATGAACNTACSGAGDYCPGMTAQPSQGCVTCIQGILDAGTDACLQKSLTDCQADSKCGPYLGCTKGCPNQ